MTAYIEALLSRVGAGGLLLLALGPLFLAFILWEVRYYRGRDVYALGDTLNNVVLATTHQLVDLMAWSVLIGLFYWVHQFRIADIRLTALSAVGLFLAQDFLYYWFHRASHRVRWLWAAHVVHHSSQRLNLSTAFRQSLMYPVAGMWVFWLPLAWLGFEPEHIVFIVAANLAYQFFVHTQAVGRLGPLEWMFNTPSHHRAHHARNPRYIDRNYGGVLIVWDRMFGTFVPESEAEPPEYGIRRQIMTDNPLLTLFHEWIDMFRDAGRPGPLSERLKHLWKPPEWERP